MSVKIWMPIYIGEYITETSRLSTEQHGAYILLIMDYWKNGALPDSDIELARITRLSLSRFKKNKDSLARLFLVADNLWKHPRIEAEFQRAEAVQKTRQENGKKGGRPKQNVNENDNLDKPKDNLEETEWLSLGKANENQKETQSQLQSQLQSNIHLNKTIHNNIIAPEGVDILVWDSFKKLRAKKRAPISDIVISRIKKEAGKASISLNEALEICCVRGWSSFQADWVSKNNENKSLKSFEKARENTLAAIKLAEEAYA